MLSRGEEPVRTLAASQNLHAQHQLPRHPLRREIHLIHLTVQLDRSILTQHKALSASIAALHPVLRKPNPLRSGPHHNHILAEFNHCKLIAVQPVRRRIRPQQRTPRNPKFTMYRRKQFRSLTRATCNYLSISPNTISIDPITATTSASKRPLHIVSSACNVAKLGFRMCTRYGLAVPSETT